MSSWRLFASRDELDNALADHIGAALRADIDAQGSAVLAVSGGSTPEGLFRRLSDTDLPWERTWITLVDERLVPPDHEDANEGLVRKHLLRDCAAGGRFVGLWNERADDRALLAETAGRLAALPHPFTCVVLGMGTDGHTASWFPQAHNLAELIDPDGASPLGLCEPVTAPHRRITLTLPAVLDAREIILHITGDEKRRVAEHAITAGAPVAAALAQDTTPVSIWWAP